MYKCLDRWIILRSPGSLCYDDAIILHDGELAPEGQVALYHVLGQCPQHLELLSTAEVDAGQRVSVLGLTHKGRDNNNLEYGQNE